MTAHDVAIIGYGPVGAILANQLGNDGFDVLVVEQMADVYDKPRAINIDHEVMRVLQSVGLAEAVDAITMPHTGTNFVGLNDRVIKRFAPIAPPYPLHWSPNLMFIQPEFEPLLRDGVARFSNVEVRLETVAKYVEQDADSVTLHLVGARRKGRATPRPFSHRLRRRHESDPQSVWVLPRRASISTNAGRWSMPG